MVTWLGWLMIGVECLTTIVAVGDDKKPAWQRVLTVILAAAVVVGILLVGTGHL